MSAGPSLTDDLTLIGEDDRFAEVVPTSRPTRSATF